MVRHIDGIAFKNMVDYAVRNLNNHCRAVNQLNVFPVPDGDTGTNMVTTIHRGLQAVTDSLPDLPTFSKSFARSVVFEARGNSGVIVSQFLKGLSEHISQSQEVGGELFIAGLENGVNCAYAAVANPVEGTMLTVLKDATAAVKHSYQADQTVHSIVTDFVSHAKVSLDNTPELLPVLKENGVVDSGGAGIVYLFEGMQKYLNGEPLEAASDAADPVAAPQINYELFNRDTRFEYGYCTELLIQLLNGREAFEEASFKDALSQLGDSLVISVEGDKVRLHIHTKTPEAVFTLCHRYGEFLTVKIENMTVQNTELMQKFLRSDEKNDANFAVVAVACDPGTQKLFVEMGADLTICNPDGVSIKDYMEAFEMAGKNNILVYPNGSDALVTAEQAQKLYQKGTVTVIRSRSIAECYASLPSIDFAETDTVRVASAIDDVIGNLYVVSVSQAKSPFVHGEHSVPAGAYYSHDRRSVISIDISLEQTVVNTIQSVVDSQLKEIVTIFHRSNIHPSRLESIARSIEQCGVCAEVFTVSVDSLSCEMTISFE